MAAWLIHAQPGAHDGLPIRVNDVDEVGVGRVEAGYRMSVLERRFSGVQAGDAVQRQSEVLL